MADSYQQKFNSNRLDQLRQQADPAADTLLQKLIEEEGKEAARQLFDQLIRHIDLPLKQLPELVQTFIRSHRQLPSWAETEQIKMGEKVFLDHGPKFMVFLYYKSLPLLYTIKNGAQVLVQTGRLAHQEDQQIQFSRRIAETGQFLIDVMAPGGIQPNGKGLEAALKVRLIHASIRAFIPKEHWDTERLGQPINQEDMAMTLMTFSIALLDALAQTGVVERKEKQNAYLHCWAIVGSMLGVDESILPSNVEEARWLMETILQRQSAPSKAGVLLTKALVQFADEHLQSKLLDNLPETLIKYFIGTKRAAFLGISKPEGCWSSILPGVVKKAFGWIEKQEDHSLLAQLINDQLSATLTRRMVGYFNPHKNASFRIPDELKRIWNI